VTPTARAKSRSLAALVALILDGTLSLGVAQTPAPPDPHADATPRFRSEIVVTPERAPSQDALTPASTTIIDGAALASVPAVHAAEVISLLRGFHTAQGQFHAGRPVVSARGFFGAGEAEYVRLLVDGVPVADVESGLVDWSLLPVSSIRRVEALRGPGASLYGDAAIGGVIQVFTDRSVAGGQANVGAGSFSTVTSDASYGRTAGPVRFNVHGMGGRTDGAFAHSGGRTFVGGGSLDGTARAVAVRWTAAGDNWTRDDPGWLSRAQLALDPTASDALYAHDRTDRHAFTTALTLRAPMTRWQPLARVYGSTRDENGVRTIPLIPGLGDSRARDLSTRAIGATGETERLFGDRRPASLHAGVDIAREHLDTTYHAVNAAGVIGALNSAATGHRDRVGFFTSVAWTPVTRMRVSAGTRWDRVADNGFIGVAAAPDQHAWSPRAGLAVQLTEGGTLSAFAQTSRAFKAPTLDQRFDPRPYPDFRGGTITISNRALVAQRARNVEAGISQNSGLARWTALVYTMRVHDEIDFDARTFRYGNIGRSRHTGVELEAERTWGRVRPAIEYTLTRVTAESDEQLKNIPRHRFVASGDVTLPWAVGVYARCLHSWGGFLDDANAFAIDGPATCDLRVRRSFRRQTFFVDAMNVTNNRFEEYGLTLTDLRGRVVPYAKPGAGRALRAGVNLSF